MNQQVQARPQQPAPPRREEPALDPDQILTISAQMVTAQLSTAKSIAVGAFGNGVDNATVVAVYDRLNEKIAELLGGDDDDEPGQE
jgi:hypothetical protein